MYKRKNIFIIIGSIAVMVTIGILTNIYRGMDYFKTSFFIKPNTYILVNNQKEILFSFSELKSIIDDFFSTIRSGSDAAKYKKWKDIRFTISVTKREDYSLEIIIVTPDTSMIIPVKNELLSHINGQPYVRNIHKEVIGKRIQLLDEAIAEMTKIKVGVNSDKLAFNIIKDNTDFETEKKILEKDVGQAYICSVEPVHIEKIYKIPILEFILLFGIGGLITGLIIVFFLEKRHTFNIYY